MGKHTDFRGQAARANYLSADRVDLHFAVKEVCRFMSAPTETSVDALKRMDLYLLGHQRLVFTYPCQHLETRSLGVQGKVRTGAIEVRKVRGDANPTDLFTKHLRPAITSTSL